jgi:hypothetical protein
MFVVRDEREIEEKRKDLKHHTKKENPNWWLGRKKSCPTT